MPDTDPMVATAMLPLFQVPLPPSLRVVVNPAHTCPVPVITPGVGFTVIVVVAEALPQLSARE